MTGLLGNTASGAATAKTKLFVGLGILVALAIALAAAYYVGYGKGKNISTTAISEYQRKVSELERDVKVAQAKVTTEVVTEYVTKVAYQDRIVYRNRDIIRNIPLRPTEQTVSNGFVYTHNRLAGAEPIDSDLANDTRASGVQEPIVLDTIAHNYDVGQKAIIQLESLQKWIKDTWAATKEAANEDSR